jgi:hypothetical protein
VRDIVGAKGGTASGAPTTSCPDGPSSLPGGRGYARPFGPRYDREAGPRYDNLRYGEMPDQVGHDGMGRPAMTARSGLE